MPRLPPPRTEGEQLDRALSPLKRALRARRTRKARPPRLLRKARARVLRARRGRRLPKPETCVETPPAGRDAISGWFMYNCPGGVLLVPSPRCVSPECRGGKKGDVPVLGYQGDLDAGTRGSFTQAGRAIGITALDGVEIQKGLAAIDDLRRENVIDAYYAGAAKRAYLQRIGEEEERPAPFVAPSPFGAPLAPGALGRVFRDKTGEDVGPTVSEACGCTPRKPDAIDPISGWLIYYVDGGVLLTPSYKCIGGGGRPPGFWNTTWRNVLGLATVQEPVAVPARPRPRIIGAQLPALPPSPAGPPPAPPTTYLCLDPRIYPLAWRPSATCDPPAIRWPG